MGELLRVLKSLGNMTSDEAFEEIALSVITNRKRKCATERELLAIAEELLVPLMRHAAMLQMLMEGRLDFEAGADGELLYMAPDNTSEAPA